MELLQKFLNKSSHQAIYKMKVDGGEPREMTVTYRFVFAEIGAPIQKGLAFLPDFAPAIGYSKDKKEKAIIYSSFNKQIKSFSLSSAIIQDAEIGFSLSTNARLSLNELTKMLSTAKFDTFEHMIASLPGSSIQMPCQVKLEGKELEVIINCKEKIIQKYTINARTNFHFSQVDDKTPSFTINNTSGQEVKLYVPTFRNVELWGLIFTILRELSIQEEKAALSALSLETVESPTKTVKQSSSPKNEENQSKNNEEEEEQPLTLSENRNSTIPKLISTIQEMKKSNKEEKNPEMKAHIKAQKQKVQRLEELGQINRALTESLKKKLIKYSKHVNTIEIDTMPTLEYPTVPKIPPSNIVEFIKPPDPQINQKETRQIIDDCLIEPHVNFKRYVGINPRFWQYNGDLGYDKNVPEYFSSSFSNATEEGSFVLLMALVKNCFNGSSISGVYGVPRSAQSPIEELASVVEYHEGNGGVLDYILNHQQLIIDSYAPAALARDFGLIRELRSIQKNSIKPSSLPSVVPYRFEHRPVETLRRWLHETLYEVKLGSRDTRLMICKLAQCILSFFSHYPVEGQTPQAFFEAAAVESRLPALERLRGREFSIAWLQMWLRLYKEGTMTAFLGDLYRGFAVRSFYLSCSCVRDPSAVAFVSECLAVFVELRLPSDFEVERESDIQAFGRALLGILQI